MNWNWKGEQTNKIATWNSCCHRWTSQPPSRGCHTSPTPLQQRFSVSIPKKWLPCLSLSPSLLIHLDLPKPKQHITIHGLLLLILPWLSWCHPPNPLLGPLIQPFCELGSRFALQKFLGSPWNLDFQAAFMRERLRRRACMITLSRYMFLWITFHLTLHPWCVFFWDFFEFFICNAFLFLNLPVYAELFIICSFFLFLPFYIFGVFRFWALINFSAVFFCGYCCFVGVISVMSFLEQGGLLNWSFLNGLLFGYWILYEFMGRVYRFLELQ